MHRIAPQAFKGQTYNIVDLSKPRRKRGREALCWVQLERQAWGLRLRLPWSLLRGDQVAISMFFLIVYVSLKDNPV